MLDGRYRLERELGRGGQGAVWLALDQRERVQRALKVIDLAHASATARERAYREAQQLAVLDHPSIVRRYDPFLDAERGLLVLVLEYVPGLPLDEALRDPAFGVGVRFELLRRLAEALAYAHARGVVHRDVKPANLVVEPGFITTPWDARLLRLVDFGIAVPVGNPAPLTREGRVAGTRAYMAPEALDPRTWGEHPDAPALDVFAWGVLAWQLLVGGHPTQIGSPDIELDLVDAYRRAYAAGGALSLPHTPWTPVLERALALRVSDRLPDGSAILQLLASPPTDAGPPSATVTEGDRAVPTGTGPVPPEPSVVPRHVPAPRRSNLFPFAVLAVMGAVVVVSLAYTANRKRTWSQYVCACCVKSPQYAGRCQEDGSVLPDDQRWWLRFQWARDNARVPLATSHAGSEVCATSKRGTQCWPATNAGLAAPLEVASRELDSGSLKLEVWEGGKVIDRMLTTHSPLATGTLCKGVIYDKATTGAISVIAFSIEPVGADLRECRGF